MSNITYILSKIEANYIFTTVFIILRYISYFRDNYLLQSFLAGHSPCKIVSEAIFVLEAFIKAWHLFANKYVHIRRPLRGDQGCARRARQSTIC